MLHVLFRRLKKVFEQKSRLEHMRQILTHVQLTHGIVSVLQTRGRGLAVYVKIDSWPVSEMLDCSTATGCIIKKSCECANTNLRNGSLP